MLREAEKIGSSIYKSVKAPTKNTSIRSRNFRLQCNAAHFRNKHNSHFVSIRVFLSLSHSLSICLVLCVFLRKWRFFFLNRFQSARNAELKSKVFLSAHEIWQYLIFVYMYISSYATLCCAFNQAITMGNIFTHCLTLC